MSKQKLGKFHFHEAADRYHVLIDMIQNYILDHPVFTQIEQLKAKAEKAQELLSEIYQDIANIEEHSNDDNPLGMMQGNQPLLLGKHRPISPKKQ
jgi:hypothetical protein